MSKMFGLTSGAKRRPNRALESKENDHACSLASLLSSNQSTPPKKSISSRPKVLAVDPLRDECYHPTAEHRRALLSHTFVTSGLK
jgi:hypothetical protein